MKPIPGRTFSILLVVLLSFSTLTIFKVKAQNTITINPDGSITGTNKIIQNRNTYTLTDNITGTGIQVQKSNIILDGAGYTIQGNKDANLRGIDLSNGRSQDPSRPEITNITIKNLQIISFYHGINNVATNNNKITDNYITDCDTGINVGGKPNDVLIESNTLVDNINGISIAYSSGNQTITKNNMIQNKVPTNNIIIVWASPEPNVHNNYWSDYTGKDTNGDGIGDTPYWYINADYAKYADNEPLMESVPLEYPTWILPTPTPTITPTPEAERMGPNPKYPEWLIPLLITIYAIALTLLAITIIKDRRKRTSK